MSAFERTVDSLVSGDLQTVVETIDARPDLVHERSQREHRATLLHYVGANGVENERQRTPANIVEIARLLLDRGAEVDAEANLYGGGATTLGLVATSAHPRAAGVQNELIDLLVARGARLDRAGGGRGVPLVNGCLANGCPEAASHLASLGAPLDFASASGIGDVETMARLFNGTARHPGEELDRAMSYAAWYGKPESMKFLLDHGLEVNRLLSDYGPGRTALHVAAYAANPAVVSLLLNHGADANARDVKWGATPTDWALEGSRNHGAPQEKYRQVMNLLKSRQSGE